MKNDQQQLAKDLYLQTEKTQQEIADILNINRRTVYLWIKNGKWEEIKLAARQGPRRLVQHIYNHIGEINDRIADREPGDRCPSMQEVEMLRKLIGMTSVIEKRNTGTYIETFSELIYFVARQDRECAQAMTKYADRYIQGNFGDNNFYLAKRRDENISEVMENLKKQDTEPGTSIDPGTTNTPADTPPTTPPATPDAVGNSEQPNGSSCDKNGINAIIASQPENTAQPSPTQPDEENINANDPAKYPTENSSENETFSTPDNDTSSIPPPIKKCLCEMKANAADCSCKLPELMQLPPEKRPSPFRDGKIIWVTDIDDVDNHRDNFGKPFPERKIGEAVRRYPDIQLALDRKKWNSPENNNNRNKAA